ncbi:MAG: hypothetical protein GKS03_10225 [Alphaproteobacteria bacterium]|nr:hypothetical protein [Alphaproteobacteria bacterium]
MLKPAVDSCFEVAFWLLDRALDDGEYLQPQKMHRLMFLAQAYYASARHGEKLMPASFVIGPEGPIEPTVFRAMERGRPMVDTTTLEEHVEHVLDSVWRQFGTKSVERLTSAIGNHPPVANAKENGLGTEISYEEIVDFYVRALSQNLNRSQSRPGQQDADAPSPDRVLRPKLMRSHTGKAVSVDRWTPRRVD